MVTITVILFSAGGTYIIALAFKNADNIEQVGSADEWSNYHVGAVFYTQVLNKSKSIIRKINGTRSRSLQVRNASFCIYK